MGSFLVLGEVFVFWSGGYEKEDRLKQVLGL